MARTVSVLGVVAEQRAEQRAGCVRAPVARVAAAALRVPSHGEAWPAWSLICTAGAGVRFASSGTCSTLLQTVDHCRLQPVAQQHPSTVSALHRRRICRAGDTSAVHLPSDA